MLEPSPLSLYIHVPWCIRKCPYCDFNSHTSEGELPQDAYITALCEDLSQEAERSGGRRLQSIFIGGGTPSLFDAASYDRLINYIQTHFVLADDIEITLEANPGTAEAGRFRDYRRLGINRLSLGIQSFDDLQLQKLGRIHDAGQARRAIAAAQSAGFDNFNLDLMYGLPGQTPEQAVQDLRVAAEHAPPHLSWYQLTIEPNTVFYSRPPALPADSVVAEIDEAGREFISGIGLSRYEVSAYAGPAHACLHNMNYWKFGDYIGVGAGAHGKLTEPAGEGIVRVRKLRQPRQYLAAAGSRDAEVLTVSAEERPIEFLMNALRLTEGFTRDEFEARTGLSFSTIGKRVECLASEGLLHTDGTRVKPSSTGYQVLNSLLEEFV